MDGRISNATASDLANAMTDYSVTSMQTDGATGSGETKYLNHDWDKQLGFYKKIPELRAVIDAKATWTVGKGFIADEMTSIILGAVKGFGKDTFNTIIENLVRTMNIGGDSFAEIIRDKDENLINLKPLDPSTIEIVVNPQGLITKYIQISKIKGKPSKTFKPTDLLHFSRNRLADEIHGVSMVNALEWVILAKNEAMGDYKTVFHRYVTPRWIIKLDEDNPTKIAAFKTKMDKANAEGENMYIPQGSVELEQMTIAPNSTLNPLSWIQYLDNMFYEVAQVPKIILGGSGEFTEASAKIAYLAFQQTIEEDQLFIEEQILIQLNLVINLEFPASLENELLSDKAKDGAVNIQPNETTAGSGQ